jgi:hypothetical protein
VKWLYVIRGQESYQCKLAVSYLYEYHCSCKLWRGRYTGEIQGSELTIESGSFRAAAAIDCQRAVSDVKITAECRHTNCNSYKQISDHQ